MFNKNWEEGSGVTATSRLRRMKQALERQSGKKLQLRVNDNRTTMLSVRWEADQARVSLHRMFLQAPGNVMEALACYIKGKHKTLAPTVKAFIEDNVKHLDYSRAVNPSTLSWKGDIHDLKALYNSINADYFDNELRLQITWFGESKPSTGSRFTFGLYHDPLRLIKIHRALDSTTVPAYLVSYVIYHEMLHHVCRPYIDAQGINRIHSKEFKELEEQFLYFEEAKRWIYHHRSSLFAARN